MADFWKQDQVVTPQDSPGPSPVPGYDLVPITGADPEKALDVQAKGFDVQAGPYEVQRAQAEARRAEAEAAKAQAEAGRGENKDLDIARNDLAAVIKAAMRAKQRSNGMFMTGFGSSMVGGNLPAGESLRGDLTIIGSNAAFDRLQKMRQESPTGGALGQVAVQELEMLKNSTAALSPGQGDADFQRNMDDVINRYSILYRKLGGDVDGLLKTDPFATDAEQTSKTLRENPREDAGPPTLGFALGPDGRVILQDRASEDRQGADTGIVGEEGGFHMEVNPALRGSNATINEMLKEGAPGNEIAEYLKGKGASDAHVLGIMAKVRDIRTWQKKNPTYKGDFRVDVERVQIPNSTWENIANSDVGVGVGSAADAATGFSMDSLAGLFGGDPEAARQALAAAQAAHPRSALAGTVAGGVGTALAAEAAAAKAGLTGVGRTAAADLVYGGAAGAGATDYGSEGAPATGMDRLTGAAMGAGAALAGGLAGSAVAGLGRGAVDPNVARMNAEGIPLTMGQQYSGGRLGGIIKRTEDRVQGLPFIGDLLQARRVEGIRKFNERSFDRALEPIGVKSSGRVGEEGVDFAQEQISDAFEKALKGKAVVADKGMATDMADAIADAMKLPRIGEELSDNIREILDPHMRGSAMSGEVMQQISRELRNLKAAYKPDPMSHRIGKAIDQVEESIFGPFRRQQPDVLPAYNRAKVAQRRLYTLADAVNAAKNKEGIFMPSQLGTADKQATIRTEGKVNAARGRGQFQDLQRAAQEVLPSLVPDSGTAGRLAQYAVPTAVLSAGGASDASGATEGVGTGLGTGLAATLLLAYTRAGQRALTKPGRGGGKTTRKVLGNEAAQRLLSAGGASGAVAAIQ